MNFNMDTDYPDLTIDAVTRVIKSGRFIGGPELEKFESKWAKFNGLPFAAGVGSGTAALELALRALGIKAGDGVITPAFNTGYAAQAIMSIGAVPLFAEVEPDTMLMDISEISRLCRKHDWIRGIIPVHLFGQMLDMKMLTDTARDFGLTVVEDAAQAHGAMFNGCLPGSYSDAACYSHYPTKNLGCLGEGGSVTTRFAFVDQQVRLLRDAGRTGRYVHMMEATNTGLDEIQAAVLNVKLPRLLAQTRKRLALATRYRLNLTGVRFQTHQTGAFHVNHLFVIRVPNREGLIRHLWNKGIPSYSHYPLPAHRQPFCAEIGLDQGPFPHAEEAAQQCVSLPLWPSMTQEEQDTVINAVKEFLFNG